MAFTGTAADPFCLGISFGAAALTLVLLQSPGGHSGGGTGGLENDGT